MIDSALAAHYLDAIGSRSSGVKALLEQARASGPTLAPFVEAMTFAPGERLIQQGSRPGALFLIVAGGVERRAFAIETIKAAGDEGLGFAGAGTGHDEDVAARSHRLPLGRRERISLGARRFHACGNFSRRRTRMKC